MITTACIWGTEVCWPFPWQMAEPAAPLLSHSTGQVDFSSSDGEPLPAPGGCGNGCSHSRSFCH